MASSGKKKTTMAKLDRERRMRERRLDKQARKDARKQASACPAGAYDDVSNGHETDETALPGAREPALDAVALVHA